ncbi:hypothetical protein F511_37983 [Dorcoceras hygrometricum]|uniref:Uncharacterized protein n=1 Tax=Dorcoceras hygrometricum TaxID=472368 RepID=A0A2Z7D5K0_9LAMI|nr:hypothetical protein F511_37983 [Dorcoceras hygrometricum]
MTGRTKQIKTTTDWFLKTTAGHFSPSQLLNCANLPVVNTQNVDLHVSLSRELSSPTQILPAATSSHAHLLPKDLTPSATTEKRNDDESLTRYSRNLKCATADSRSDSVLLLRHQQLITDFINSCYH